jgi:hypothetical protein
MMKEEFENLIGLEISQAEYDPIETYYVSLPTSVDKQKFAKDWLKNNGIQNLFNKRAEDLALLQMRFNDLREKLDFEDKDRVEWIQRSNEQSNRIKELEQKLAAIKTLAKGVTA